MVTVMNYLQIVLGERCGWWIVEATRRSLRSLFFYKLPKAETLCTGNLQGARDGMK